MTSKPSTLPPAYNPNEIEPEIYRRWEASGFFNPDKLPGKRGKPFVIAMPPPNITGELHIGHALGFTIQDILIRYHRMRGRAALWIPGTDHAAISTQVVVERELRKEGLDRRRLGREKFLDRVWAWKERYGRLIVDQTKRIGASADWSRERFTMDKQLTAAVYAAFKKLYDDGLIYRGERIINWCSDCRTAISDLEVERQETPGRLWYLRYPLSDGSGSLTVATTRPETMLGDTAVAVHPDDERYRRFVGQTVRLPLVGRDVPIVADKRIDKDFGTGAVKVTPGHDPLDFELGQTHHLPILTVIGFDGRMTNAAGLDFAGLSVPEACQRVLERLRALNAVEKEEDYIHAVGYCERSKTPIEPLVSLQWFVKAGPLAKNALRAVQSGEIRILPTRFKKVYVHWLKNIRDWNISRQIWWGHRLPVWYKKGGRRELIKVSAVRPGPEWKQDEDTLDTWFSSGLWTFSTLGWPRATSDLKRFHPTSVMVTGWDILFFWVARMVMLSTHLLGEVPFRTVYLHGLVLDANGKKMSKSKGTGVDPIPMAEKYGTDALRLSLIIGNAPGQDFRLYEQKIEGYRNFANKIWNVARYILSQPRPSGPARPTSQADYWIQQRLESVIRATTDALERFDLSAAGDELYAFVWHDFADWYLETSKVQRNNGLLYVVLEQTLRLLHPFMPFVTEALWAKLGTDGLLMVSTWPKVRSGRSSSAVDTKFAGLQTTVVALRNFKLRCGLPANEPGDYVGPFDADLLQALSGIPLRRVARLVVSGDYREIVLGQARFRFAAAAADRFERWRAQERQELERYIDRLANKLSAPGFTAKAPVDVVAQEKQKLAAAKQRLLEL